MSVYLNLLVHSCTIQRASYSTTSTGVKKATYNNLATNVQCLVQEKTGKLIIIDSGKKVPITYLVFMKANQDVKENDQIRWNSRTFVVTKAPPEDPSGTFHHKEIEMEQVTGA